MNEKKLKKRERNLGNLGCASIIIIFSMILLTLFFLNPNNKKNFIKKGEFIGLSKNRTYIYYTKTDDFDAILRHAKMQYWSKGATSMVFYFTNKDTIPTNISKDVFIIDERYKKYCIAAYYRYDSGRSEYIKYPFR